MVTRRRVSCKLYTHSEDAKKVGLEFSVSIDFIYTNDLVL
jgi:hypothetical protein